MPPPPGANSDWSNVAFSLNNIELHSWVESQGNPSRIWVLLPDGVPAGKSITINMWVGASSVSWDSYRGEAPQLSGTYGQYDNGATVFPTLYDGFAGTSLNTTLWQTDSNASVISVNNQLEINLGNSEYGLVVSKAKYAYPLIAEGLYHINNTAGAPQYCGPAEGLTQTAATQVNLYNGAYLNESYNAVIASSATVASLSYISSAGGQAGISSTDGTALEAIIGMLWSATGKQYGFVNDNPSSALVGTDTNLAIADYYIEALGFGTGGGGSGQAYCQWFRTRQVPPNNVMPSVSVSYPGIVSGVTDSNGNITMNLFNIEYTLKFSGSSLLQAYTVTINPPVNTTFTLYKITNNGRDSVTINGNVNLASGTSTYVYGGKGMTIYTSDPNFYEWSPSSLFTNPYSSTGTLATTLSSDLNLTYTLNLATFIFKSNIAFDWYVVINGTSFYSSGTDSITATIAAGTYSYTAYSNAAITGPPGYVIAGADWSGVSPAGLVSASPTQTVTTNLTWVSVPVQNITASENFTVPAGIGHALVAMLGAGGGGGAGNNSTNSVGSGAGGGGLIFWTPLTAGTVIPITIGAGGAGAPAGGSQGTAGGNTVFGNSTDPYYAIAGGGAGGLSAEPTINSYPAGGTYTLPTGSEISQLASGDGINGNIGAGVGVAGGGAVNPLHYTTSIATGYITPNTLGAGGAGGSDTGPGGNGSNYGAGGGGGGYVPSTGTENNGGNGASGQIVLWLFP